MELITIYLRRKTNQNGTKSVIAFNDKNATSLKAIFNYSPLPNKRRKTIILNGFKFNCQWI
jgi:hypothetical protein